MWKKCYVNPFDLYIPFKATRFISSLIRLTSSNVEYAIIFVYAPAKQEFKHDFRLRLLLIR